MVYEEPFFVLDMHYSWTSTAIKQPPTCIKWPVIKVQKLLSIKYLQIKSVLTGQLYWVAAANFWSSWWAATTKFNTFSLVLEKGMKEKSPKKKVMTDENIQTKVNHVQCVIYQTRETVFH